MLMMRRFKATRLAGLILLALSLVAGWQVTVIPSPPVYAEVGPHLVPGVSAVFLTLLALAYLLADRQGLSVDASDDPDERPHEGANKRLLWYGLGLLALIVLIPIAGLGPAGAEIVRAHAIVAEEEDDLRLRHGEHVLEEGIEGRVHGDHVGCRAHYGLGRLVPVEGQLARGRLDEENLRTLGQARAAGLHNDRRAFDRWGLPLFNLRCE
ncbi:MAG: hypothetical protein EBZ09_06980, partial [Betaproteobacteria bacterium]|nr:hypothetical protein [Betaproteobacteria bacterium]